MFNPNTSTHFTIQQDGCVTINGVSGILETIRPWGHPKGFGVDGCHRESYNGEARPMFLLHAIRYYGNPTGQPQTVHRPTAEPIDQIARSIPRDVLMAIYHIPHWPIELIQLAEVYPEAFVLLCKSNPALAALLGRLGATHTLWGPRYFGQYLGRDENDICRQIGYGSEIATYLRRFADVSLSAHGYLDMALTAWRKPGMSRLLTHLPLITLDTMVTAMNHWQIARECPSILHLTSEKQDSETDYSTTVYENVEAVQQMRRSMRKPAWPWNKIKSVDQLQKIRQETEEAAFKAGTLAHTVYPAPPVSPCAEWGWISESQELADLGRQYQNCASSHHWKCLTGDCAIYVSRRTGFDETVIVSLIRDRATNSWSIGDIVGPRNSLVDEEDAEKARLHFEIALEKGGAE